MLLREDYLLIIDQIRNIEKISLDDYIEQYLQPLKASDPNFIITLYKDIFYVLDGLDKPGDNDLEIENGDFIIEDGDIKLSGYQTRLHDITIWLHMETVTEFSKEAKHPNELMDKIQTFEANVLQRKNYTPEYKSKLDAIRKSMKKERENNSGVKKSWVAKVFDPDNLELKPNIAGIGVNLNEIINKLRNK